MELTVSEHVDGERWDAALREIGGTIYHSSVWARYIRAASPNAAPRFMTLTSEDGNTVGMALGFQERSRHRLLAPLTGHVRFESMPAVGEEDGGILTEFLRLVESYALDLGSAELTVGSYASFQGARSLAELGFDVTKRVEFELDLGPSEDDLWNGLEYKRRKNIKKAKRSGVAIRGLPPDQAVPVLRSLQGESSKRIVARGGPDISFHGEAERDAANALLESGIGRVVGAEVDGQVVSAGLFTCFNGLVYHTLSGHSREALKTQAPTLLLWETILRYKQEGAARLNFGGCSIGAIEEDSPEHGVYAYKKAFGGHCRECTSGHKVLRTGAHAIVRLARAVLRR